MSENIDIIEVASPKQLDAFITLPNKIYADEKNYVWPLISERKEFFDKKRNPFYRGAKTKLFLAKRGDEYVGRIATCINFNHNEFHAENVGFFGFFDTIDDYDVAAKLLKVAMITLKSEGMEKMRGPANFSTNHEIGFLVDGFDKPPMVMMTYNRPYLPQFAEKFGLKKVMDLNAYLLTDRIPLNERHLNLVNKLKERFRIKIRTLDLSRFKEEVELVNRLYNLAWEQNWGFVPLPKDEFDYTAKNLKEIVDPDLVLIATVDDKPAGFSLALPDINQALIDLKGRLFPFGFLKLLWNIKVKKKINGIRLITMGVVPEFQKRGIDSIFYVETYQRGVQKGYNHAELSWILETNELMNSAARNMGANLYKKYRLVEMPL
ncbi:MAG: N-acetyltransferase [candidate division Zixibacteria bacterium]|nr:N-acetyltransferase [candidate division Zixibacteria bacterium]